MFIIILVLIKFLLIEQFSSISFNNETEEIRKISPGFFLTIPKILITGKNETICLTFHHTLPPWKVVIDLKIKEKHFFTNKNIELEHTCFNLFVPNQLKLKELQLVTIRTQIQLNGVIYTAHNQESIFLYPNKNFYFIETDRNIYKANDKILIRILVLNYNLLPIENFHISMVKIRNPLDIIVTVWENVTTEFGLTQLEHELEQNSIVGKWKLEVDDHIRYFHVNKYILPRFKVELIHDKIIYSGISSISVTVCGKYSYGKSVNGNAFLKLTDSHHHMKIIQTNKKMENGCANFTYSSLDLSLHTIKDKYTMYDPKLQIFLTATITEYGTDNMEMTTGKILIHLKPYGMNFNTDQNVFYPGLPFEAIKKSWNYVNNEYCSNFSVGIENVIKFHVPPLKNNVIHFNLHAKSLNHTNIGDSFLIIRHYSPTNSYIILEQNFLENFKCKSIQEFTVVYTTDKLQEHKNLTFFYLLKSRGQIMKIKKIQHTIRKIYLNYNLTNLIGGNHKFVKYGIPIDKFTLKFKLDEKIITNYQLLIYYIIEDTGETVAATKEIFLESCLPNKVKAFWSKNETYPGSEAILNIQTNPNSLCFVSSVDRSTTFFKNSPEFNADIFLKSTFFNENETLQTNTKSCLPPTKKNKEPSSYIQTRDDFDLKRRRKRFVYSFSEDFDVYDTINKFGIVVITNMKIITKTCYTGPSQGARNIVQLLTDQYNTDDKEKILPIRSYFPETWLWESIPIRKGDNVPIKLRRHLPHTITNWITNVFCISKNHGIGFSNPTEISGFQPFFIDVLTPYSMKRGEILYLNVAVFNYLNSSFPVRISLRESQGLKLVDPFNRRTVSFCIKDASTITHVFEIKALEIGLKNVTVLAELDSNYPGQCGPNVSVNRRDIVFKTLLVEPEGYPVINTKSALLCNDQTLNNVSWSLDIPNGIISETDNAKIIINGDILGSTIENLDELVSIPTGCGEQILSSLAPNLFILQYLNLTSNLTPSLKQRIFRNLKIGYQRILNFAHKDGSFSAFGANDPSGSMFLTSFVVRTLQELKKIIYVDQRVIDRSVEWIFTHQLENGCFNSMLHVFQDMGGASSENSTAALTSYVMINLFEANIDVPETVQTNAKYCIRGHYHLDKYTLAISSYALYKIHWYSEADRMIKKLLQISNRQNNMMWWNSKDFNNSSASDIEITSYVLLSLLSYKNNENLANAHAIVRWLVSQKGPYGGFKSTQDTVVALDALTKYSIFITAKKLNLKISINALNENQQINLTNDDKLKTKTIKLKETKNNIYVETTGEGCALIQAIQTYYIRKLPLNEAFKLDLEVSPVSNIDQCSITAISPCVTYSGPDEQANMAVLEVNLPSGYQADRASLFKLVEPESKVKMFEEINDKVVLYFTKLDKQQICVNFYINENIFVDSRTESLIKLYDYYKPEYELLQFFKVNDKCKIKNSTIPQIFINKSMSNNN